MRINKRNKAIRRGEGGFGSLRPNYLRPRPQRIVYACEIGVFMEGGGHG